MSRQIYRAPSNPFNENIQEKTRKILASVFRPQDCAVLQAQPENGNSSEGRNFESPQIPTTDISTPTPLNSICTLSLLCLKHPPSSLCNQLYHNFNVLQRSMVSRYCCGKSLSSMLNIGKPQNQVLTMSSAHRSCCSKSICAPLFIYMTSSHSDMSLYP